MSNLLSPSTPVYLLFLLLVTACAVSGFVLLGYRRRTGRARRRAEVEVERWQTHLATAAERLIELESQHPLYFTTAERWTGASLETDRCCAEAVNRTYMLYSKAHELLQRARARMVGGGTWKPTPYDEVWRLLRHEPIRLEAGVPAEGRDARRLTVPLEHAFESTSSRLLEDLDEASRSALECLGEVAAIEAECARAGERAGAAATEAVAACARRIELELPAGHLTASLEPVLDQRRRVDLELVTDPRAATERLEELAASLDNLARLAVAGNRIGEALRGAATNQLEELRRRVAELRSDGWRLREPGFDPDLRLDRGAEQAARAWRLLAEGDEERAITEHASLRRGLDELGEMIDASLRARAEIPERLETLRTEAEALRGRLPAARELLERLEQVAPTACPPAGEDLDQLEPIRGQLDGWLEHIRDDHREERYLSALEDVETARRLLARGHALVDRLEHTAKELDARRAEAEKSLEAAAARRDRLAAQLGAEGVPESAAKRHRDLAEQLHQARQAAAAPRPDWIEVALLAGDLDDELARLEDEVRADREAHAAATRRAEELLGRGRSLDSQVRHEVRDRPHVKQAVREAQEKLETWHRRLEESELAGRLLAEEAEAVNRRLEWVAGLWRSELDIVHLATTELRAAEARVAGGDRRAHGHGVIADCRAARSLVEEATDAAGRRSWEQVVTLARGAAEAAEAESTRAHREARRREEEERRRLARAERRRRAHEARRLEAPCQCRRQAAGIFEKTAWPRAGTSASSFGHRSSRRLEGAAAVGAAADGVAVTETDADS